MSTLRQHTIKDNISLKGVGLHTGKEVTMVLKPAGENTGVRFKRVDLPDTEELLADVSKVVSTNRGTTIKSGPVQISTIEHTLSALVGLGIDNILIEIDGPEVPILDGSAKEVVDAILEVGMEEQNAEREYFEIKETISYRDEVSGSEIMALPSDKFEVTTLIDFNSPVLGQQYASLEDLENYKDEIAPCRTFVFLHELEALMGQGLIQGGDLDNAVVIVDRMMDDEDLKVLSQKLGKKDVKVKNEGVLNTSELRFHNEPARHKLLDVMGDLALVGKPIQGRIVATKPGHTANVEFARLLKKKWIEERKLKGMPKYDPQAEPLMDSVEIMRRIPHRYPFLLVDKIMELNDRSVVGIKNLSFNEEFFQGHFPGNPIMPGVLQIEAMAQTGGILALSTVEDPHNWDTYFMKIDNVKFKHKVTPGDTLIMKLELTAPIRRGICQMIGTAYVGNKLVSEGELTAQIIKTRNDDEPNI